MKDVSFLVGYCARRAQDDEVIDPTPERPADLAARYAPHTESTCRALVEAALATT